MFSRETNRQLFSSLLRLKKRPFRNNATHSLKYEAPKEPFVFTLLLHTSGERPIEIDYDVAQHFSLALQFCLGNFSNRGIL